MDEDRLPILKKYPQKFAQSTFPESFDSDKTLNLVIIMADSDLSLRDLSAYLSLIDHIYGRMSPPGFTEYSHSTESHFKVLEVRHKCLEFILSCLPDKSDVGNIVIVYLFLKYLHPLSLANAYKTYEEARLTRFRRKRMKHDMHKDDMLKNLNNHEINKLISLFEYFQLQEIRLIPRASRFTTKSVKEIKIILKDSSISNGKLKGGNDGSGP